MSVSSNKNNRLSINFDAIAGTGVVDEETWLIPPPSAETQTDSSTQSSGHIIEWLQGATQNMDYRTRSALGRSLANQALKKKQKKAQKLLAKAAEGKCVLNESQLSEITETLGEDELRNYEVKFASADSRKPEPTSTITANEGPRMEVVGKGVHKPTDVHGQKELGRSLHSDASKQFSPADVVAKLEALTAGDMAIEDVRSEFGRCSDFENEVSNPMLSACKVGFVGETMLEDSEDELFYDACSDPEIFSPPTASFFQQHSSSETRSVEKVKPISQELTSVDESVEPPVFQNASYLQPMPAVMQRRSLDSYEGRGGSWSPRQTNTARVAPISHKPQKATADAMERSPWSPRSDASPGIRGTPSSVGKSSSHSSGGPDLVDINKIVEQQELALRETLRLQRKSSTQSENGQTPPTRPQTGLEGGTPGKVNTSMASSRSVDFFGDSSISASTHAGAPSAHLSRLPTPVRRPTAGGTRSMIPAPASRSTAKATIRGFACGSTPSLSIPARRPVDAQSEGGQSDGSEQRWTDECF